MFKWIIIVALLISGSVLTYLYYNVKSLEQNVSALPKAQVSDAIRLIHSYKNGRHYYVGSIKLPNSCHSITASIERDQKLADIFELRIETRDLQMETPFCSQLTSRYQFAVDEEGPKEVTLTVKYNGKLRPHNITESTRATTDLLNQ